MKQEFVYHSLKFHKTHCELPTEYVLAGITPLLAFSCSGEGTGFKKQPFSTIFVQCFKYLAFISVVSDEGLQQDNYNFNRLHLIMVLLWQIFAPLEPLLPFCPPTLKHQQVNFCNSSWL